MRILITTMIWILVSAASQCPAVEKFLEAPIFPNAQVLKQTDSKLVLKTQEGFSEVLAFYKKSLSDMKDIKFRDWGHAIYIEDDGNRPWHSITIAKPSQSSGNGVVITIRKDSWTWIFSTLLLRYVGVFVVLVVILICMSISGTLLSKKFKASQQ